MTISIDSLFLSRLPGAIGFKDINSIYLGGNEQLASHMGFSRPQDIIGISDNDIRSEMVCLADKFIADDIRVIKYGEQQHIDVGFYPDGDYRVSFATKKPLFDESDNIIGVVFYRTDLSASLLQKLLFKTDFLKSPGYFSVGEQFGDYALTQREAQTLFYFIRGYTAKEIALRLKLSRKTVEYYVEQLKNKFSCNKRSELIEKCISMGFFYNVPSSILT